MKITGEKIRNQIYNPGHFDLGIKIGETAKSILNYAHDFASKL